MDNLDELELDKSKAVISFERIANELYFLGADKERIILFEKLRNLIAEKDLQNDPIAVEILSWAYDQLANF
jgi:hypothetical protein